MRTPPTMDWVIAPEAPTVWPPANVYATARLGRGVSIGTFSEVGNEVEIGDDSRIGAQCFLCEGVYIGKNCFVGPNSTFTNDRYPMSPREKWEQTIVHDGAAIGAGVTVLCGLEIGENAIVGAGSTVTKSIPAGEIWAGNPARFIRKREHKEQP